MGKASDLTSVQKTIIEILHKEGKEQKDIASRAGCSQSSVSKLLHGKAAGRKKCDWKLATTERNDCSLERIVRSNRFNNLVEITRECQDHGVTVSRATIHRRLQTGNGLPQLHSSDQAPSELPAEAEASRLVNRKEELDVAHWTKVLFTNESKFCITFGNIGPRVWRLPGEENQPGCTKSSVKFPQSVMVWGAMAAGGVGQLCFLKSNVNVEVYQQVLEYFMPPAGEEIFRCTDFMFRQDLAPAHSARSTMRWLEDHDIEVLPLACKFTRPQSNGEFVGTDEKENVDGATKHPRGTQRCHLKSVELGHTSGLL